MNDSPYIFPQLAATRDGIPDPLVETDCWLRQLQDVLEEGPQTADEAYDLLALWAKLRRVRPELIDRKDGAKSLARADVLLASHGARWVLQAVTIPHPQAWLQEAQALEIAFQELGAAEHRSALAERLLSDLDDAGLVLYASRRHAVDDRELEGGLERCQQWFGEHVELFLPAALHVQAVGMALRPDLAEFDYGLAVTALKYVDVLRATEMAERELSLVDVQQLEPLVARRLATRFQQQRERILAAKAAFLTRVAVAVRNRMRQTPLAQAGEAMVLEPLWWWEWSSPTGEAFARLTIPPQPAADQHVILEFLEAEQRRATGLAGQTVTLHGLAAAIDRQAKATFPLAQLLETDEPLVLRVGPNQLQWLLTDANTAI